MAGPVSVRRRATEAEIEASWIPHVLRERGASVPTSISRMIDAAKMYAAQQRLPFDPSLRHAMPDRPPDRAWIGFEQGVIREYLENPGVPPDAPWTERYTIRDVPQWRVKVYREWDDRAKRFAELWSQHTRVPSRAVEVARQLHRHYGYPIDWTSAPPGAR